MAEHQPRTEAPDVFDRIRQSLQEMHAKDRGKVDPEALAGKLADRARMLRGRAGKAEGRGPRISFLAFSHGPHRYGIPLSDVIEVQPLRDYTPVPGAPPFIPGVIHWRGAILSLVDLVRLFGLGESGLVDERACVIVESAGRRIGILAAEVEELHTVGLDQVRPAPDLAAGVPPEWALGIHDENRLILQMEHNLQDERLADWRDT
jgi:purine-binding chemotaxis protein CheW